MNKLRDKFDKLFEPDFLKITDAEYYDGDEIGDAIWNWINQNYISKEEINGLKMKHWVCSEEFLRVGYNSAVDEINQKIEELIK